MVLPATETPGALGTPATFPRSDFVNFSVIAPDRGAFAVNVTTTALPVPKSVAADVITLVLRSTLMLLPATTTWGGLGTPGALSPRSDFVKVRVIGAA